MSYKDLIVRENNNVIVRQEGVYINEKLFSDFNKVWVSGIIEDEFEYSHENFWEKFYRSRIKVERLSGTVDYIPLIVSNLLIYNISRESLKGKYVEVAGQFRSFNKKGDDGRRHLDLFLFATAINIYESEVEFEEVANANLIYLDGYICKPPVFRTTPLGRQITDLLIGVNRSYNKSDYIPCIAWGRNAQFANELEVGNRVKLYGRIQSRQYLKRFSPGSEEGEMKEVYEISIMRLMKIEELLLEG